MIPPPSKLRFNLPFRAWVNALILPITLYLFAVSFIFLTNAFLLGTYKHAFGHAGYTLLTAVGLAGFLYVFRKDRRDLAATLILYLLLNVPGALAQIRMLEMSSICHGASRRTTVVRSRLPY